MSRITGGTIFDTECGNVPEHLLRKGKNYYINNIFKTKKALKKRKESLSERNISFVTITKTCMGKKRYILYDQD